MAYRYALAEHGLTLATRPFGRELRDDLVERAAGEGRLELDFSGVLSVSHSFVDELVARLAQESQAGAVDFEVAVLGTTSEVDAVIRRALGRREAQLAQAA